MRRTVAIVIVGWLVLAGGAAHARDEGKEAKRLFAQGNRAFDEGRVQVGIAHDTPHFAVDSIGSWWEHAGRERSPLRLAPALPLLHERSSQWAG